MITTRFRFYPVMMLMAALALSFAAPQMAVASSQPIDISADRALEWDRQNNRYIARGNAVAVQGDTVLKAAELRALYTSQSTGMTDITEIQAEGNVEILNDQVTLHGSQGRYDVVSGLARLTGDNLRMLSEDAVVTASDYFEYDAAAQQVRARGNAVVVQGDDRLETGYLIAHLIQNAQGETVIDRIEAPGAVTIITPRERITGDQGRYDLVNEIAILTGNVTITQGENMLTGNKAEVDMQSGVSRLTADAGQDGQQPGRVRGVFHPRSE